MLNEAYIMASIAGSVLNHGGKVLAVDRNKPAAELYKRVKAFAQDVVDVLGVDFEVFGELPEYGTPAIICQNHTSNLDPPINALLPGRHYFATKKLLFQLPVFGPAIKRIGMPMITRADPTKDIQSLDAAADFIIRETKENLSNPAYLVVYPEGTRTKKDENYKMKRFKMGAFRTAEKFGLPIIPIASYGAGNILPSETLSLTPGTVYLKIFDPLLPDIDNLSAEELRDRTFETISSGISELREESGKYK